MPAVSASPAWVISFVCVAPLGPSRSWGDEDGSGMTSWTEAGWESVDMGLVLQLVETGADTRGRGIDVLELDRPRDLRDTANLGLTLLEAKQLLARVQQAVVAVQARDHAALRPECSRCGARCHVKDWRPRQIATLLGEAAVRLPRFLCPGCGRSETGVSWPAYCRSTPALDRLQAHLSALMTHRVAAGVLAHLLPVAAGTSQETLRGRTLQPGEQLRRAATVTPEPGRRRQRRHRRSPSAWTPPTSAAAKRASGTWRCASATLRHPRAAAGRCLALWRTPAPTSWRRSGAPSTPWAGPATPR
jgi:hypothetical protein